MRNLVISTSRAARSRWPTTSASGRRCSFTCATRRPRMKIFARCSPAQGRHPPRRPALLFSCNGRGTHLFEEPGHDIAFTHGAMPARRRRILRRRRDRPGRREELRPRLHRQPRDLPARGNARGVSHLRDVFSHPGRTARLRRTACGFAHHPTSTQPSTAPFDVASVDRRRRPAAISCAAAARTSTSPPAPYRAVAARSVSSTRTVAATTSSRRSDHRVQDPKEKGVLRSPTCAAGERGLGVRLPQGPANDESGVCWITLGRPAVRRRACPLHR